MGASPGASRVVGTGWPASGLPKAIHFASKESSPIAAWATNSGPETAPGTAPGAVPPPPDVSATAAESAGPPGIRVLAAASVIASGTVAFSVFPPT